MSRRERRVAAKRARTERKLIPEAMRKLRQKAEDKRGTAPRTDVAGWSFILSIDMSVEEMGGESFLQQLKKMVPGLKDDSHEYPCAEHEHWHFSARLQPIGRSSVTEDWFNLGVATEAMGVPNEAIEFAQEQVKNNPGGAIHYSWIKPRQKQQAPSN